MFLRNYIKRLLIKLIAAPHPPPQPKIRKEGSASTELSESTLVDDVSTDIEVDHVEADIIDNKKPESIQNQGRLILDATVTEQAIRFPTDLSLLNESREISEHLIDELYQVSSLTKKPRTYRRIARKAYLAIVKLRRPEAKNYVKASKNNFSIWNVICLRLNPY